MRFLTLAAALATVFFGVQAYNPIGEPCTPQGELFHTPTSLCAMLICFSAGGEGCSADPSLNGGNAFIYECGPTNTFVYLAGCRCPTCCEVTDSGAFCT